MSALRDHPKSCMWDAKGNRLQRRGRGSRVHFTPFYKFIPHPCGNDKILLRKIIFKIKLYERKS